MATEAWVVCTKENRQNNEYDQIDSRAFMDQSSRERIACKYDALIKCITIEISKSVREAFLRSPAKTYLLSIFVNLSTPRPKGRAWLKFTLSRACFPP